MRKNSKLTVGLIITMEGIAIGTICHPDWYRIFQSIILFNRQSVQRWYLLPVSFVLSQTNILRSHNSYITIAHSHILLVLALAKIIPSHNPGCYWDSCYLILCCMFVNRCLSLFLSPLCCLFLFGLRMLLTPLVSSSSSDG